MVILVSAGGGQRAIRCLVRAVLPALTSFFLLVSSTIIVDTALITPAHALTTAECLAILKPNKKKEKKEEKKEEKKKRDTPEKQAEGSDEEQTKEHEEAMEEQEEAANAAVLARCQELLGENYDKMVEARNDLLEKAKAGGATAEELARMEQNMKEFEARMQNWASNYEDHHPKEYGGTKNGDLIRKTQQQATETYNQLDRIYEHDGKTLFEAYGEKTSRTQIVDESLALIGAEAVNFTDQGSNPSCYTCSFEKFGQAVAPDKYAQFIADSQTRYSVDKNGKPNYFYATNAKGGTDKIPAYVIRPGPHEESFNVATLTESSIRGPVGRIVEHGMLTAYLQGGDGQGPVYNSQRGTGDGEIQGTSLRYFGERIPDSGDFRSIADQKAAAIKGEVRVVTKQGYGHATTNNFAWRLNEQTGKYETYAINDNQWGERGEALVPIGQADLSLAGIPGGGGFGGARNPFAGGGGLFNNGGGGGTTTPYQQNQQQQQQQQPYNDGEPDGATQPWDKPDDYKDNWPTPWEKPEESDTMNQETDTREQESEAADASDMEDSEMVSTENSTQPVDTDSATSAANTNQMTEVEEETVAVVSDEENPSDEMSDFEF